MFIWLHFFVLFLNRCVITALVPSSLAADDDDDDDDVLCTVLD